MNVVKERIKTVLLIALVFSSLFLTQVNLFDGLIMSEGATEEIEVNSTKLSMYINPQSYFVSFGGLSYTKVYDLKMQDNLWTEIRPFILSSFLNNESIEEINREDYVKAFSDRSLLVRMPVDLSVSQFYSIFSDKVLSDQITDITPREYLLREGNVRSLYVFDAVNSKYYLIKHKTMQHDVGALIDAVKNTEIVDYRKLSDRFSLSSTVDALYDTLNYELIPYQYDFIVSGIKVQNEVRMEDAYFNQDVSSISGSVFGNRLDFVKKLKDVNDSVVLMYGYGDKSLTVSKIGNIAYRQKFDPQSSKLLNFKDAFSLAAGKLENFGFMPEGIFLASYEYDKVTKTYTFNFNYKLNSLSIAELDQRVDPIRIKVQENQVVAIDKNIKSFAGEYTPADFINSSRMFTIDDCITSNIVELNVYYLQDNNIQDNTLEKYKYYYAIVSEIKSIELKYFEESDQSEQYMIPVWEVKIGNRVYIFNAYDGKLIKTYIIIAEKR